MVRGGPRPVEADDDQGAAGSQVPTEGVEGIGERQVVDRGDAGDDVVGPGGKVGQGVGDGEGGRRRRGSQRARPCGDHRIRIDAVDRVGAGGEQAGQVTGAGTDVQRAPEPAGELPQDPAVVVGVVVPGVNGVEPVECLEEPMRR
ncbi:hypothetical protein GCM10023257_64530 [Streptomyces hyderabadensis]|uniref:Uncharacterized protein n=1 Tax=Streptomyces hyderabadensis TaxID=598549 RepID=A0ABP9ISW0_9ACTN